MEYNIIVAPNLEILATEVAGFLPMGWKLKGGIVEHTTGYAQQLIRKPSDSLKSRKQYADTAPRQRRTRWIE